MEDRIMSLFSLIAEQVDHQQDLFTNEGPIMDRLLSSGYHLYEADTALTLMQNLVQGQAEDLAPRRGGAAAVLFRSLNQEERARFTLEAFGFVTKLCHLGIISEDLREELIEKAMAAHTGRIGLDQMKSLIALVLFAPGQDHEETVHSLLTRMRNTAWN